MVFEIFANLLDPIFSPLLVLPPVISLFLFSAILTAISFGINRLMVNKNVLKQLKENMNSIREKIAIAQKQGKKDEVNGLLDEMMKTYNQYWRQTFKMTVVTLGVLIILFPWANFRYADITVIAHPFVEMLKSIPLLNLIPNWLVWYIVTSITINWLLSKFIGVVR